MGLNFRDVLNVLGEYPGDPGPPGGDCAGLVLQAGAGTGAAHLRTGEAALGISVASLASVARGPAAWLAPKPAALSFEAACTLPITWSTVHAALGGAQLRRGQAMLVHAAAGGVGLVAVEYAHWLGSVVHATAGRPYKHQLVSHLGAVRGDLRAISLSSSRDGAAFARGAACALRSGRLAAVLNSLSADFISASAALLGEGGAFEEIGKRGVWSAARMQHSRAAARYEVLAIDDDMHQDPPWMQRVLQRLSRRAAAGVLHGLPTQTFDLAREWEAAFRLLQSGRNLGKVVLRVCLQHSSPSLGVSFGTLSSQLLQYTDASVRQLAALELGQAYALLERLCQQYVQAALQALQGQAVPRWHHQLLLNWFKEQPPPPEPFITREEVLQAHPDLWPEVTTAPSEQSPSGSDRWTLTCQQPVLTPASPLARWLLLSVVVLGSLTR